MAKEWTDEEVQAEIREAVRIVNEDREKATYAELHSRYGTQPENDGEEGEEGKKPPPAKKKPEKDETVTKKKSIWWAEDSDSE